MTARGWRAVRSGLVLAAVVGASACGRSSDEPLGPNVLRDLERQARSQGYTEQADILAQGYVSQDDLLTAIENARQCVRGHGFEVSAILRDSRGAMSYNFTLPEDAVTEQNIALADECQFRYSSYVEQAYDRLHPTNDQAVVARVTACAEPDAAGSSPSFDTFRELQAAVEAAPGSALESCYVSILSEQTIVVR